MQDHNYLKRTEEILYLLNSYLVYSVSPVQDKPKQSKPNKAKKRSNDTDVSSHPSAPPAKKEHSDSPKTKPVEGVTEADVRRYLRHKPMTTKELLKKFKRKTNMDGHDLVVQLGNVLKKVNPQQEKVKGKVLLSLKK
jgi:transcription initiation factor TFIIF subunit alpha